jgi:hypothetical protein
MKPRAAPTQMKTVPSGRVDFCMNGALDVSGTIMVGTPTPSMLGAPVMENLDTVPAAAVSADVDEEEVVVVEVLLVLLVLEEVVVDEVLPSSFWVSELRSGASVS